MIYNFRTPPKILIPQSSRWYAVFKLNSEIEIWMLDLRNAKPNFFYPVFCRLEKDTPIASYEIPSNLETLRKDSRAIKGFGNRFFWSHATETFVIQIAQTFEYSEKSESEQIFLAGESFGTVKVLSKEDLLFLPSSEYKEVFPEMHPDRSRSD